MLLPDFLLIITAETWDTTTRWFVHSAHSNCRCSSRRGSLMNSDAVPGRRVVKLRKRKSEIKIKWICDMNNDVVASSAAFFYRQFPATLFLSASPVLIECKATTTTPHSNAKWCDFFELAWPSFRMRTHCRVKESQCERERKKRIKWLS